MVCMNCCAGRQRGISRHLLWTVADGQCTAYISVPLSPSTRMVIGFYTTWGITG